MKTQDEKEHMAMRKLYDAEMAKVEKYINLARRYAEYQSGTITVDLEANKQRELCEQMAALCYDSAQLLMSRSWN